MSSGFFLLVVRKNGEVLQLAKNELANFKFLMGDRVTIVSSDKKSGVKHTLNEKDGDLIIELGNGDSLLLNDFFNNAAFYSNPNPVLELAGHYLDDNGSDQSESTPSHHDSTTSLFSDENQPINFDFLTGDEIWQEFSSPIWEYAPYILGGVGAIAAASGGGSSSDGSGSGSSDGSSDGSSSGSATVPDAVPDITGRVADGYIEGAQIYLDQDNDGLADDNERLEGVFTDEDGYFSMAADANPNNYDIIAKGGVNTDTGVVNTISLRGAAGSEIINPITTLAETLIDNGQAANQEAAAEIVIKALGLKEGIDLKTYDPLADLAADSNDTEAMEAQKAAVQIVSLITMASKEALESGDDETVQSNEAAILSNIAEVLVNNIAKNEADGTSDPVNLMNGSVIDDAIVGLEIDTIVRDEIVAAAREIEESETPEAIADVQEKYLDYVAPSAAINIEINEFATNPVVVKVELDVDSTDGSAVFIDDVIKVYEVGSESTSLHSEYKVDEDDITNGYAEIILNNLTDEKEYTLTATITDSAGNTEGESTAQDTFTLDTTPPDAPTITLPTDTGAADGVTQNRTVTVVLSGGDADQASWEYSLDSGANWQTGSGNSFDLATDVEYSTNAIQVRQTDTAGNNSSTANNTVAITTDNTAPEAPSVELPSDTGADDNITQNRTVTVTMSDGGVSWQYRLNSNDDNDWVNETGSSFELADNTEYPAGTIEVRQIDGAGNVSAIASNSDALTVDNIVPEAPAVTLPSDTGNSNTDGLTNDTTVNVELSDGGVSWQYRLNSSDDNDWVNGTGSSFELEGGANREYTAGSIEVRQLDGAGNASSIFNNSDAITIDTVALAAPGFSLQNDTSNTDNNNSDGITTDGVVNLGDNEDRVSWEFSLNGGSSWQTGTGTSFNLAENTTYAPEQIQVRQTDAAGNVSLVGKNDSAITVDNTAPDAPELNLNTDTGSSDSDSITRDWVVNVNVDSADVRWEYRLKSNDEADWVDDETGWQNGDGSSFELAANATYNANDIEVRQFDAAGNVSDAGSNESTFIIDNTPLTEPTLALNADTGSNTSDNITSNRAVDVTLSDDQVKWEYSLNNGSSWTEGSGESFDLAVDTTYDDGHIQVRQYDAAGNVSTVGTINTEITTDNTGPDAPGLTLNEDTGSNSNDDVTNDLTMNVTLADDQDRWEFRLNGGDWTDGGSGTSFELEAGVEYAAGAIQVRQFDAAGNVSAITSSETAITTDTTAPAAPEVTLNEDTGSDNSDGVTSDLTMNVTVADDAATWEYSLDNGDNWTEGSGDSFELAANTSYAANVIKVRQTDAAGNTSNVFQYPNAITTDTTAPAAPSFSLTEDTGTATGANNDNITSNKNITVTLSGGSDDKASWEYSVDGGDSWTTGDNSLSFDLADNTTYAVDDIQVRQTDTAGNVSDIVTNDTVYRTDNTAPEITEASFSFGSILNAAEDDSPASLSVETTGVENGQTVTLMLNNQAYNGIVSNNVATISGIPAADLQALADLTTDDTGTTVNYTVDVSDLAGNTATSFPGSFEYNTNQPTILSDGFNFESELNANEDDNDGTLEITTTGVEDTREATLTLNGEEYVATVTGGSATFTVGSTVLQDLEQGEYDYTVEVSNAAETPADTLTGSFTKDTVSPEIIDATFNFGPVLNATEDDNDAVLSVTTSGVENGETVTLLLNGQGYTGQVNNNLAEITVGGVPLRQITEADEVDYTVTVSDAAGNAAQAYEGDFKYDKSAPTFTAGAFNFGSVLNASEDDNNGTLTITTTNVEDEEQATLTLNGINYTATVNDNSATFTVSSTVLQGLNQGDHTYTINVSDAAGNAAAEQSGSFNKDSLKPEITSATFNFDDTLNATSDDNDATLTVSTTGLDDGRPVTLTLNGKSYTENVSGDTVTISVPAADLQDIPESDAVSFTVTASDAAGNAADTFNGSFSYDAGVPEVTSASFDFGDTLNAVGDDNDATLTASTTGIEDGQTLTLGLGGNNYIGEVNNNSVAITVPAGDLDDLTEGTVNYTLTVSDVAGNAATVPADTSFTYDATAPAQPTLLTLNADTGNSNSDNITNDLTMNVTLSGDAGDQAIWQYKLKNADWVTGSGDSFELDANTTYAVGEIQIRQTDDAGNISEVTSNTAAITTDSIAPDAPGLALATDTGSSDSDNLTNDQTINVTLTGAEGDQASWAYRLKDGSWITGTASNSFELAANETYAEGEIEVRQTDTAGNESITSNSEEITTDTTATVAPGLELIQDTGVDGVDNTDGVTSSLTMRVSVTGTAADNNWQYQLKGGSWINHTGTSFTLEENTTYAIGEIKVRQIDAAGNVSAEAQNEAQIVTDIQAPDAPTFSLAADTGSENDDNVTNNRMINVVLSGTAGAGDQAKWEYKLKDGSWTNDDGTSFELAANTVYAIGEISVRQIDAAGNISDERSNTQRITTDNQLPDAPTFELADDTGSDGEDNITNEQTVYVTFSGGAEDRVSWKFSVDGGTTWDTGNGNSFELLEGTYAVDAIQVTQQDSAGNDSAAATNAEAITIDTTAFAAPTFALAEDTSDDGTNTDNVTSASTVNVTLDAEQDKWEYSLDSGASWTEGSSNSFDLAADTVYGENQIQVRQYDVAGNVSDAGTNNNAITTDNTAPDAPTFRIAEASDTGSSNSDNISQNTTVTVSLAADQVKWQYKLKDAAWVDGTNTSFELADNTTYEANEIRVRQIDAAGNVSEEETNESVFKTDNTAPTITDVTFSFGTTLNAAEAAAESSAQVTTSGVENGESVTLNVNGNGYTGSVENNVTTITLPASAWDNLADGSVDYTVNVSDVAGNGAGVNTGSFEFNTTTPTLTSDGFNFGSELNATEDDSPATLTINTNVEDGQTVTLNINADEYIDTAQVSGGTATFTVANSVLQTLTEGVNNYTVNVSDANANPADEFTGSFTYDKTPPEITESTFDFGAVLNGIDDDTDRVLTVTTSGVQDGNDVTLTLNDKTYTGTVNDNSATINVNATDLQSLAEGNNTYTLKVKDNAGNETTNSDGSFSYDSVAPAAEATVTEVLTANTSPSISGTFDNTETTLTSVTVNSVTYELSNGALSVDGSSWTLVIPASDALDYGHYDVEVVVSDAAGNPTSQNFEDVLEVEEGLVEGTSGADTFTANDTDQTFHIKENNDTVYLSEFRNVASDALRIELVSENSGVQTYGIFVVASQVADADEGLGSVDIELSFSTSAVTYEADSANKASDFTQITASDSADDITDGVVTFSGFSSPGYTDYDTAFATFNVTPANADAPIEFTFNKITLDNAEKETFTTVTNIGTGGANKVIFEGDPSENGVDTIYGFTVDRGEAENDTIEIHHVDMDSLRGNGDQAENLTSGATMGANTGFVVLKDALDDLESATVQTAALAFGGEADGDVIYLLSTNGTDSKLARITYENDSATVEFMAEFIGLGELSGFDQSNIYEFTLNDTVAPIIDSVSFSFGDVLTAEEDDNNAVVTINTTGVESGQEITFSIGVNNYTGDVSDNSASITIPAADLQALTEGAVTYTVNVSDASGNAAEEFEGNFTYDATVPTIESAIFDFGTELNATEDNESQTLTVTTTGVEDGREVTLTIGEDDFTAEVSGNSAIITLTSANLTALSEGPVNYTITVSDVAGNEAEDFEGTFTYDVSVPTPGVTLADDTGAADNDGITSNLTVDVDLSSDNASWEYSVDGGTTWEEGEGTSFDLTENTDYAANAIQVRQTDTAGNVSSVGSISNAVSTDNTAPSVDSVVLDADIQQVTITYDVDLDETNTPSISAFTVSVGNDIATVNSVAVSGQTVVLELADGSFSSGSSVTVAYEDPSDNDDIASIQDIAGNDASDFSTVKVIDGYIRGAQIYLDADGDGIADNDELLEGVVTDAFGSYVLEAADNPNNYGIIAKGGINTDTGIVNTLTYKATSGSTVVNPLTTIIQALIEGGSVADEAAANTLIASALGTFTNIDLTTYDPLAEGNDATAISVQKVAVQIVSLLAIALQGRDVNSIESLQNDIISNIASAMKDFEPTPFAQSFNFANDTFVSVFLSGMGLGTDTIATINTLMDALQDVDSIEDIQTLQSQYLDTVTPDKPTEVTLESDEYDSTPTLRVTLNVTSVDGQAAVVGDEVTIEENGAGFHTYILTADDIASGYADVTLPELSRTGDFTLDVFVKDKSEKVSATSESITFTYQSLVTGTTGADSEVANDTYQAFDLGGGNDKVYLSEYRNAGSDAFSIVLEGTSGSTQTYGIYVKEDQVDQSTRVGLNAVDFTLTFDDTTIDYVASSATKAGGFDNMTINDDAPGTITFSGFTAPGFETYDTALVTFQVIPADTTLPIDFNLTGISLDNISKDDLTIATNIGSGGADTVIFEADPADNGEDEIYGFAMGLTEAENDTISFDNLDNATLRGNGNQAELLTSGSALGNDTGIVIISDALDNLESATFETAALGLEGEAGGDVIYFLASDGTDAKLAEITYNNNATATVQFMSTFVGLGTLSLIDQSNLSDFTII
ncbi:Ig-like domain-containing protein [uncultured Endozoicomonas sp.]|uniref:Ig-like domain-containing protein n=1 Tax=uncultured Endozoicomonas sp. TaxID=432652 RepID=UPI00261CEA6E|nr:Ig-like domain-containing protein [uncultured Endozoicomonas sp.]